MRVISGIAGGKQLKPPKRLKIRPTSDRVKEALFNIIKDRVMDSVFLDLFAGTGNIGIEALSRGAASVVFVEFHFKTLQLIKKNIALTGLDHLTKIIQGKIPFCLSNLKDKYDIIFLDPPYLKGLINPTLEEISKNKLLMLGGQVIVESSKLEILPQEINSLVLVRKEKYGDTFISFYMEKR